jgi:allantoate deiminase
MSPSGGPGIERALADHRAVADAVDQSRLTALIERFAELSEGGAGVSRLAYTALERQAHEVFADHMRLLDLDLRTDPAGNTIAELGAGDLPAIGTGSHLDSVPGGGMFDGIAGVVAAMECARVIVSSGWTLTHPLRFVAFAAEEGARFGQACTGSRLATGLTRAEDLPILHDADNISIAEAMQRVRLDPTAVADALWQPHDWAAFVELHIEQGSVLESLGTDIGIVDNISGSTRLRLALTGLAAHTGGTPMHQRSDALAAAAECVLIAERLANDPRHHGTRATVGVLDVEPGSITTIPGRVSMSVDIRDVDSDRQRDTALEFVERAHALCKGRGVELSYQWLADASPVVLPGWVRDIVAGSAEDCGLSWHVMSSGASHDSQMVNHVVPAGMIFVPSRGGISHTPDEWTSPQELAAGTRTLVASLLTLDRVLTEQREAA